MCTCSQIQDELLAAASPATLAGCDALVATHLNACTACQSLLKQIEAIEAMEARVKAVPTPSACATAQQRFLQQLPVTTPAPARPRRRSVVLGWATAAAVFLALGVTAYVLAPVPEVQANAQVMESLVEWNLKLSETDQLEERDRLHRDGRVKLHDAVRMAKLSARERLLADQLLDHADWLAAHDDMLDAAERFQELAGAVLEVLDESPQTEQYAVAYSNLMDRGVEANLERVPATQSDAKRQARLARLAKKQQQQQAKLKAMEAKLTAAAREKAQPKKKAKHPK